VNPRFESTNSPAFLGSPNIHSNGARQSSFRFEITSPNVGMNAWD